MRDYAMNRAMASESLGSTLLSLFHNWQARRETSRLLASRDSDLALQGLTRDDIRRVLALPLRYNPRLALEDLAFRRAHG